MFGPSSHTIARKNVCQGNHGAGIALVGDLDSAGRKWKAFHWIIEQNRLIDNRWGVYMKHADWIDVAANVFKGNSQGDIHRRRRRDPAEPECRPFPVSTPRLGPCSPARPRSS